MNSPHVSAANPAAQKINKRMWEDGLINAAGKIEVQMDSETIECALALQHRLRSVNRLSAGKIQL